MGESLCKKLVAEGFCMLSFDLYGHGLSNAPEVDLCDCSFPCCKRRRPRLYTIDFFVDQTEELLLWLGLEATPVNIIGFSLGGTITVAFAKRHPDQVKRLLVMSPAGFLPKIPCLWYVLQACWCCIILLLPRMLCACLCQQATFIRSLKKNNASLADSVAENSWKRFVWQFYFKRGAAGATLAVTHRIPWFNLRDMFLEVGKHPRPVLLIWGLHDKLNPVIPVAEEVKQCFSNCGLVVVRDAGHISICDQPHLVAFHTLKFLQMPLDVDIEIACLGTGDEDPHNLEAGERSQEFVYLPPAIDSSEGLHISTLMHDTIDKDTMTPTNAKESDAAIELACDEYDSNHENISI